MAALHDKTVGTGGAEAGGCGHMRAASGAQGWLQSMSNHASEESPLWLSLRQLRVQLYWGGAAGHLLGYSHELGLHRCAAVHTRQWAEALRLGGFEWRTDV